MPRIDDLTKQQRAERIWLTVKANQLGITEAEIADELNMERRTVNNYLRDLEYEGKVFKDGRSWYPLNLRGTRLQSFELSPEEAVTLYEYLRDSLQPDLLSPGSTPSPTANAASAVELRADVAGRICVNATDSAYRTVLVRLDDGMGLNLWGRTCASWISA